MPPLGRDAPRFKDDPKIVDTQFERIDDVIMGGVGWGGMGDVLALLTFQFGCTMTPEINGSSIKT